MGEIRGADFRLDGADQINNLQGDWLMSETKFTPGPWRIAKQFACHSNIGTDLIDVCKTECTKIDGARIAPDDQNRADAALIAAAPELYVALEEAQRILSLAHDHDAPVMVRVEQALRKARGE